jgi:hypothetical protein
MKTLETHRMDPRVGLEEVAELRRWLDQNPTLAEKGQILPFFRAHRHLAAFVGSYSRDVRRFDRIGFEYPLLGDFSCDLIVGDSARHA